MKLKRKLALVVFVALPFVAIASCKSKPKPPRNRLDENYFPHLVLWAWERPEDLKAIDPNRFAIAFLAQTLVLKAGNVAFDPRHQPLDVAPQTKLIAVTRIESQKTTGQRAALSDAQRQRLVTLILKTAELRNVSAIQIDFDAAVSEREFYRALLHELRAKLPDRVPLSITALASFCVGDRWLDDLPVDEAVPMIFRMGADDRTIKNFLAGGEDFREPLCQKSYGIAVDEPLEIKFKAERRIYIFNDRSWSAADVSAITEKFAK
ncbi:MAG TPA: DUF3142 domain-containing protein [Pyrinomonadaceae bacterium]|nr:DUF3142 domain-containing protein [Pyrinomonadaceae bacterium]